MEQKRERETDIKEDDDYDQIKSAEKKCKLEENFCKIPVGGKYAEKYGNYAICSPEDYENLSKYKWHISKCGYVKATKKTGPRSKHQISMSRSLLNPPKNMFVDHINGDRKDNRRENLRITNARQNAQNKIKKSGCSSKYHGVSFDKQKGKFASYLADGATKRRSLGYYVSETDAAKAYDLYLFQNKETLGLCHKFNFPNNLKEYENQPLLIPKEKKSYTNFRYVCQERGKFKCKFDLNNKTLRLGKFDTPEEAAKCVDDYIVSNKLNKKLNFPERYPNYSIEKQKSFITEIDYENQVIQSALKDIAKFSPLKDLNPEKDVLVQIGGKIKDKYTLIERDDFDRIKNYSLLKDKGYVVVYKSKKRIRLHRYLFDLDESNYDVMVDHVSSNVWDNRKRFLKVGSVSDNARNKRKKDGVSSSKYIGVCKTPKSWRSTVLYEKKVVFERYLSDEEDAGRLRDLYVQHHYPGQYRLNFDDWENHDTKIFWTQKLKEYVIW